MKEVVTFRKRIRSAYLRRLTHGPQAWPYIYRCSLLLKSSRVCRLFPLDHHHARPLLPHLPHPQKAAQHRPPPPPGPPHNHLHPVGPALLRYAHHLLCHDSLSSIIQPTTGWLAWTCDAVDFFSVSLSVTRLTEQFDRPTHDIVRPYSRLLTLISHADNVSTIKNRQRRSLLPSCFVQPVP